MIGETDVAVLTVDLPAYGLKAGDVGTIVMVHGSRGYEVEFMTLDGEPIAIVSVDAAQVRAVVSSHMSGASEFDVRIHRGCARPLPHHHREYAV